MNALVYNRPISGPSTHALIIGVGNYPHLKDGKSPIKFANAGRMGQLKSPPHSARAIARWLIEEYRHPSKPLASLSLLISDPVTSVFNYQLGRRMKSVKPPPASMLEVKQAIRKWRAAGNENPDHLLLFYFCGHGIARLPDLALLLSDFGATPEAPLEGALNFRLFRQNMVECAAREQLYFVDACRVGSELLIANDGHAGDPVIERINSTNHSESIRQAPVFYSTLSGARSYALIGQPSIFTNALLEAFSGAGSGDEEGQWRVRTNLLHDALSFLMKDATERLGLAKPQIPPVDDLSLIQLNEISIPHVPVVVTCRPEKANAQAVLSYENQGLKKRRRPSTEPWRIRLPAGTYDFAAELKGREFKRCGFQVRPAYRWVPLDVEI
jgi:hypothetical protein